MKIFLLLLLWLMLISMLSYLCFLTKSGDIGVDKNRTIGKEYSKELNSTELNNTELNKTELNRSKILDTHKEMNSTTITKNISKESNGSQEGNRSSSEKNQTIEYITTLFDGNKSEKNETSILKEKKIEENITDTDIENDINSSLEEKLIEQYEEESRYTTPPTHTVKREDKSGLSQCKNRLKKVLSQNKIYFYPNSVKIQKRSYGILDKIINISKECKNAKIVIAGYTDSIGSEKNNLKISRKRANSVKEYFIKKGIEEDRLEAVGYGEANPIASNKTAKGREKNRRIEINIKGENDE